MSAIRFISGSGRSGTTWIQDSLASANGLRPVFEPLHPYLSDVGNEYAHRALAADEDHPALKQFLVRAAAGRGPRLWTQYRQQLRWLFPPPDEFWSKRDAGRTKRHWSKFLREAPKLTRDGFRREPLIKCIRANLMLPWIARNLDCRVVLIVRHPGAVVESELRSRWNASFALERFRNDAKLHALTGGRYRALLARELSSVEALTLRWLIENQWVVDAAAAHGVTIIHYEDLRSPHDNAWSRLCAALDVKHVPGKQTLSVPSQQSAATLRSSSKPRSRMSRWMERLTTDQINRVRDVLESAGFNGYSMDDPAPRITGGMQTGTRTAEAVP